MTCIKVYRTPGWTPDWLIEPAPVKRVWMDKTPNKFAYRCLPLTLANTSGWIIRSPATFFASWCGGPAQSDLRITMRSESAEYHRAIVSHFGSGVLTFQIPFLFQTEPFIPLSVRGCPNFIIDGAHPLEGIVETDWCPFTFTMNWKMSALGGALFEKGDPICFVQPVSTVLLQSEVVIADLSSNPLLAAKYNEWRRHRAKFNADPTRQPHEWEKRYTEEASHKALTVAPPKEAIK